jgi:mono/diheme cytochrome c family protein
MLALLALPCLAMGITIATAAETATTPVNSIAPSPDLAKTKDEFTSVILPFVQQNCYECHGKGQRKGGLNLDTYLSADSMLQHRSTWQNVLDRVQAGEMPPKEATTKPNPTQAKLALAAIDDVLSADGGSAKAPPHMTLRRLNRAEYVNTVRDLLLLPDFDAGQDFPKDENGYGFDNIADLLTVSPLLFEQYLKTADLAVNQLRNNKTATTALMVTGYPVESFTNKSEYAHQVLGDLLTRAWRRPVSKDEIERLYKFVALSFAQNGEQAKNGLYLALRAILVSPEFLFRVELDDGLQGKNGLPTIPDDYKLANRLSYFLWSSMPDDDLFDLASTNKLHEPAVLKAQVQRMLKDPKAHALSVNFSGQWLLLRNLQQAAPDPKLFPQFNDTLRQAMWQETEWFFETVVNEDRSIMDFIDGNFTFVNGPLAKLYGIPGVEGPDFQRVTLTGNQRSGILTQASILTVTSYATRTSPVQRGKWILENILNRPPPPPPDNVPALDDNHRQLTGTVRQKMEQHRTDPTCASCHQTMDPLGFALENYDSIGAWRDKYGTDDIDSSGTLPDGKTFLGAPGLKEVLRAQEGDFRRCLVEKMLVYALGRGLDYHDTRAVEQITAQVAQNQDHFSSLITAIVSSDLFQGVHSTQASTTPATASAPIETNPPAKTSDAPLSGPTNHPGQPSTPS